MVYYVREEWVAAVDGPAIAGRSFPRSFHLPLLGLTGAYWLDDPSDLSCKDDTRQHAVDDPLLSCKQQVGGLFALGSVSRIGSPGWGVANVPAEGRRGLLAPPIRKRNAPVVDMKLELVPVPMSDVDRAKTFTSRRLGSASISTTW